MKCTNPKCKAVFTDEEKTPFTCPNCDSPLNINIIHDKVGKIGLDFFRERTSSMWKFLPFLPLRNAANIVTLGEGSTPLLPASNLGKDLKLKNLLMKNETINPTGSYIDRQISLGISVAKELGFQKAISLSTGNVGASVAAYSARAGFKSLCVVPSNYKAGKIQQIKLYGGNVIQIKSNSEKSLMDLVIKGSKAFNAVNLATTSLYNAFTNHGAKTILYEIFEQLETELPDLIVVPVGGGALISAIMQACLELKELNFISEVPDFIAVQPEGCHPFIDAITMNLTPEEVYANAWKNVKTEISALAYDIPFDYSWFYMLKKQVKGSKISGIVVSDAETRAAQKLLSKREGLFVEMASATVIAALKKIGANSNELSQFNKVCVILTGTGILDVDQETKDISIPPAYPDNLDWEKVMKPYFS
nr:pyridoxal-phosphate dependent enzyme [Candidatus Sigynarchaeota archaeon]